jgi:hypothetical protein
MQAGAADANHDTTYHQLSMSLHVGQQETCQSLCQVQQQDMYACQWHVSADQVCVATDRSPLR